VTGRFIIDAGPLVALLSKRDRYHGWALETFAGVNPPALTCEAVLAEAWYRLPRQVGGTVRRSRGDHHRSGFLNLPQARPENHSLDLPARRIAAFAGNGVAS